MNSSSPYAQHRLALDLIIEHGQVPTLAEAFSAFSAETSGLEAHTSRSTDLYFHASSWLVLPDFLVADTNRWKIACPVHLWFSVKGAKLYLRLEVGLVRDTANFDRSKFIIELRTMLDEREKKSTKNIFTRIRTVSTSLTDESTIEETSTAMKKLWTLMGGQKTIDIVEAAAVLCIRPPPGGN